MVAGRFLKSYRAGSTPVPPIIFFKGEIIYVDKRKNDKTA